MSIAIKRVYEVPAKSDGTRILVDRVWPRGITKAEADVHEWLKEVAPSTELRKWFNHDPAKWPEFEAKYEKELKTNAALSELITLAKKGKVTLIYSARDEEHNQAVVIAKVVQKALK